METIIYDQTPLAEYLKEEGKETQLDWTSHGPGSDILIDTPPPSPPNPPSGFAPTGRPFVKSRFRNKIPASLNFGLPSAISPISSTKERLSSLQDGGTVLASQLGRADNSRFIEQFRYTIIASQLLSGHSVSGLPAQAQNHKLSADPNVPGPTGLLLTAVGALGLAWFISWLCGGGIAHLTKKRLVVYIMVLTVACTTSKAYIRQQWLKHVRIQALVEISTFASRAQDFDSVLSAALALIQEVELVLRGYRLSAPLPPISRIENRSQIRRCIRLRKALRKNFETIIPKFEQATSVIKGFSEQLDLERYYDIYDMSDLDMSDANLGYSENEFEDMESLRTLKIVTSRFHILRGMFLCALLSMEPQGEDSDFLLWTTVVESLRALNETTNESYELLTTILSEEQSFSILPPISEKSLLSPGRERWRSQLRKLNSLTTGIRGLQAKMTLLREESDRALNEANDISEIGTNLREQYESIGQDLKMLLQAWEDGQAALATGIDRNFKRISSLSGMLSSGITQTYAVAEETNSGGSASEAFRALEGGNEDAASNSSEHNEEQVFEAVATTPSRLRSLLTREERIAKMQEERERRAEAKEKADASRGMLKELEMVINLRPKRNGSSNQRQTTPPLKTERTLS